MPEEVSKKSISTKQITVPLIAVGSLVFSMLGFCSALFIFGFSNFLEKEKYKINFDLLSVVKREVTGPIGQELEEVNSRLHFIEKSFFDFQKETKQSQFGKFHYEIIVDYYNKNGHLPSYNQTHEEAIKIFKLMNQ